MSNELNGKRIAILATDGVEQVELETPRERLADAGADVVFLAPGSDDVQAVESDINPADTFTPDSDVADADPAEFDALVLPGGTANPDTLRIDQDAMRFIKAFVGSGKPVASICHGPWTLVEADAVRGRTLTSWPSLQTDIRNAGGTWVDDSAVTCHDGPFTLVTSRNPDDLDDFCAAAIEAFAD